MRVKLEEICKRIYAGGDVPKNRYSVERTGKYNIPIYANAEKDMGLYGYTDEAREFDVAVTVAARGTIGFAAIRNEPFLPVVRLITIVPELEKVTPQYLLYALKNYKPKSSGTSIPQLTVPEIKRYSFNLVGLNEQKRISGILDKLFNIIEKRNIELLEYDKLIKARFIEMFDLDGCSYGTFGNDTDFVDYRGKTPELSDEGTIRMVNAKSVGKGSFKDVNEYVTEQTYKDWMHRGFGYPGDILFVTEGHTFGNTCLVPYYLTKFALGQRVITIKGHSKIVDNTFLCAYMQTEQFRKDIDVFRTGGTAQGIRSKDLVKVRIPLPSVEKQKQFADFVHQVDKSKVVVQKALDETQTLFDSLMQEYFG